MKASSETEAITSVAHSQGCERANATPSPISRRADRAPADSDTERIRSAKMHAAENRNVPLSMTNAVPAPTRATAAPPSAGPTRRIAPSRMSWSSALASTSRSPVTMSGTSALKAGPKNASPAPKSTTSAARCQTSRTPASESAPITASTAARTRSAAIMTRRRSSRSLTTPPNSRKATIPDVHASPTSDRAAGSLDRSYTCQATATR